jgi:hypothetical protein
VWEHRCERSQGMGRVYIYEIHLRELFSSLWVRTQPLEKSIYLKGSVIKHPERIADRRRVYFSLQLRQLRSSSFTVGTLQGQEHETAGYTHPHLEADRNGCMHALLLICIQLDFSIHIAQGPSREWCCPLQTSLPKSISLIKTTSYKQSHRPAHVNGISLGLSSKVTLSCVKLTKLSQVLKGTNTSLLCYNWHQTSTWVLVGTKHIEKVAQDTGNVQSYILLFSRSNLLVIRARPSKTKINNTP